jgi:TM2 domain-containing membrane protein YozV
MFLMTNSKFFDEQHIPAIRDGLMRLPDSAWIEVQTLQFKDPTTSIIISFLGGSLGIDRFMIGDTGIGVGKLLTCGGLGVWAIIDLFLIMGATRAKNFAKIEPYL